MNVPYYVRSVMPKPGQRELSHAFGVKAPKNVWPLLDGTKFVTGDDIAIITKLLGGDDHYSLSINAKSGITVGYSSERSLRYAIQVLNGLAEPNQGSYRLPYVEIDDWPSIKSRGIIEGFYGVPYSQDDRLDLISFMSACRMNMYVYAPKDDLYHRKLWRVDYPKAKFDEIHELISKCQSLNIDFCYAISPGNDFDYSKKEDYEALFHKLSAVSADGVRHFALLLDDIEYKLSENNQKLFQRPGLAHAHLANELNKMLKANIPGSSLVMCPTEYYTLEESPYRSDLRDNMDNDIEVFFTGLNVMAQKISTEDMEKVKKAFGKTFVIWDNHPVNDYIPQRLITAPVNNRTKDMPKYVSGYVSNPMNQWQASKVGVLSIANYAWNVDSYDPEKSFRDSLKLYGVDEKALGLFFRANYMNVTSLGDNLKYREALVTGNVMVIKEFYDSLLKAVSILEKGDSKLIKEISPWFKRARLESAVFDKFLSHTLSKNDIVEMNSYPYWLGVDIIDVVVRASGLLTDQEFSEYLGPIKLRISEMFK